MKKNIRNLFLSIENNDDYTKGKYAGKKQQIFDYIRKWQNEKFVKNLSIKPLQYTFEITNRCNCNCQHCGMMANGNQDKKRLNLCELYGIIDGLFECGIPGYAVTGGEPFIEFNNLCKVICYAKGKVDIIKLISNGFWGENVNYYFSKLINSGLLKNKFFIPNLQISIGEQDVKLEFVCNIINYYVNNFKQSDLHLGIINTRILGKRISKLEILIDKYEELYGEFPKGRIFLTESNYVNVNLDDKIRKKLNVPVFCAKDIICDCDNTFQQTIGKFVGPKIFMKCNGDCYPCEIFNLHSAMYLGNYFKDGLAFVLKNLNKNKYIKFIKKYGTKGFNNVIDKKTMESNYFETSCNACEFCIKYCEKNKLLGEL